MKAENRRGIEVVYHMKWYTNNIMGNTKIAHLSLKKIGRFLFNMARGYDNFKPYYSRVSFDGKYRMEC